MIRNGITCAVQRRERLVEPRRREEQVQPDGREQESQFQVRQEDHAEVDRVDVVGRPERHDQRRQDDDRRVDLHDAAHDQQEDVQRQQEHRRRLDVRLDPRENLVGNLGVHQVVGQPHRDAEQDQHGAHQAGRLQQHARQRLEQVQVAGDEALDDHGVRQRRGRRLHHREPAGRRTARSRRTGAPAPTSPARSRRPVPSRRTPAAAGSTRRPMKMP